MPRHGASWSAVLLAFWRWWSSVVIRNKSIWVLLWEIKIQNDLFSSLEKIKEMVVFQREMVTLNGELY